MTESAFSNVITGSSLRTDVVGFLRYWSIRRPIFAGQLQSILHGVEQKQNDGLFNLPLYEIKYEADFIPLSGLIVGQKPALVLVHEDGEFEASYESPEQFLYSPFARKTARMIRVKPYNWLCSVIEFFPYYPTAAVIKNGRAILVAGIDSLPIGVYKSEVDDEYPFDVFRTPRVWNEGDDYEDHWSKFKGNQQALWKGGWQVVTHYHHKSSCAYDSTEKYLKNVLGVTLNSTDEKWYQDNEKVLPAGLPMEHTLGVLGELVAPYEIEIGRVWVSEKSQLNMFPEYIEFGSRNGVNGLISEAAMVAGARPRLFIAEPVPALPLVVCATAGSEMPGGHAEFVAPRAAVPANWDIALDFRRMK